MIADDSFTQNHVPSSLSEMVSVTRGSQNKQIILSANVTDLFQNKAISMMRGKSPRSDVEMSKKIFRGGHLGFLAAILD